MLTAGRSETRARPAGSDWIGANERRGKEKKVGTGDLNEEGIIVDL